MRQRIRRRLTAIVLIALSVLAGGARAAEDDAGNAAGGFRLVLVNGAILHGRPADETIEIAAEGRTRRVRLANLESLSPGWHRRPDVVAEVRQLETDLADDSFATREAALRRLVELGPDVRGLLEPYRDDVDTERRHRVRRLLKRFRSFRPPRVPQDRIETHDETLLGAVDSDEIEFSTPYGRLRVPLADVSLLRPDGLARVDLLKSLDAERRSVRGEWTLEQGTLISPPNVAWALLQFEIEPPSDYALDLVVERKQGHDALVLPIIVGGRECNVCIDGWPRNGVHHTGLELIRGQGPLTNVTRHRGDLLTPNKPHTVHVDVTPATVQLDVDGRRIFAWKGDPNEFSMQPGWTRPDTTVLGIGSYEARFHIATLDMIPAPEPLPAVRTTDGTLVVELENGTRFAATLHEDDMLSVRAGEERRTVPLADLRSMTAMEDTDQVRIELDGREPMLVTIEPSSLRMATEWGELRVPARDMTQMNRSIRRDGEPSRGATSPKRRRGR